MLKVPQGRLHTLVFVSDSLGTIAFYTCTFTSSPFLVGSKKCQIEYFSVSHFLCCRCFFFVVSLQVSYVFCATRNESCFFGVPTFCWTETKRSLFSSEFRIIGEGIETWRKNRAIFRKNTVDGWNPAQFIPLFTRFDESQVVQDFFHQQ